MAVTDSSSGLAGLARLPTRLAPAHGLVTEVRRTYGGEIEVEFRRDPSEGAEDGRWLLGTQASDWVLLDQNRNVALAARDEPSPSALAKRLKGRRIMRLELEPDGGLAAQLDDGSRFRVHGSDEPEPPPCGLPSWELLTPDDMVIVAGGPGPGWAEYPADMPESWLAALAPGRGASNLDEELAHQEARWAAGIRRAERLACILACCSALCLVLMAVGSRRRGAGGARRSRRR
jgi:hypothetical protein